METGGLHSSLSPIFRNKSARPCDFHVIVAISICLREAQEIMSMKRRDLLSTALAGSALLLVGGRSGAAAENFEITRTESEWRSLLTPIEYNVMREEGTERSGSSPLDKEYGPGTYYCRGCDLAVYSSEHKYDSGTGWPSFWQSLPDAVRTKKDRGLFSVRTEVHCRRCGSHFGHIFSDGPAPTGKRHCLNGVSLVFKAA
jgi:peptide-methionine (R)-S-oxide reductase